MSELTLFNESIVDESEIDSLGHMNVRYYVTRAASANNELLKRLGVTDALGNGQVIRRVDTYNRFHREQFAGARLHTLGGLVTGERISDATGICAYFEIRNPDTGDVAATFILTSTVVNTDTQQTMAPQEPSASTTQKFAIHVPEYGVPRSLSIKAPKMVSLADIEPYIIEDPTPGMMSGRRVNEVHADDCDANGRLREDIDLMFVLHRPQPGQDLSTMGPPVVRDEQGRRYSWAMMETRSVVWQRPMAGEMVVSLGADLAAGDKWRQSRRWMFEQSTGKLLGISDSLGLCIDLDARRSIPMPEDVRAAVLKNLLPQFS